MNVVQNTRLDRRHPLPTLRLICFPLLLLSFSYSHAEIETSATFAAEYNVTSRFTPGVPQEGIFSEADLPLETRTIDDRDIDTGISQNGVIFNANIFENIEGTTEPNFNFATKLDGLGELAVSATTVINQVVTNTTGARAALLVNFTIYEGGVALNNIAPDPDQTMSARVQYEVQRNGEVVYGGVALADTVAGVSVTGNLPSLSGFAISDSSDAKSASWTDTVVAMNLGVFEADESVTLQFVLTTQVDGNTSCVSPGPSGCPLSVARFNDPCRGCRFVALSNEVTSDDEDGWQPEEVPNPFDVFVDADGESQPGDGPGPDGAVFDGNDHPYVGLIVFDYPDGSSQRCAGSLMAPNVVLTAGHCTDGASAGRIWFDSTETAILAKGYPNAGFGAYEFASIYTSPNYDAENFVENDVGVVTLINSVPTDRFATLPDVGALNGLKSGGGKKQSLLTAIGHGLAETIAQPARFLLTRMQAELRLLQINVRGTVADYAMLLSNNPTGGILCVGDSGGPHLLKDSDIIGGITSFAKNQNCAGTVGAYRLDREIDRYWLEQCIAGSCW